MIPMNGMGAVFVVQLGFFFIAFMELMLLFVPLYVLACWFRKVIDPLGINPNSKRKGH